MKSCISRFAVFMVSLMLSSAWADNYKINPGDVLRVVVWNEEALTVETLVRPDGQIGLPLAGQIQVGGLDPAVAEANISKALQKYLKDAPSVTVMVLRADGNKIFVIGKVNRPGEFPINRPTDVMQALALGSGLNQFAAENNIKILRRDADGKQFSIPFEYSDVKNGEALETNILLQSGDIVVVP
jgi:polysaccharide export outer membrane protein